MWTTNNRMRVVEGGHIDFYFNYDNQLNIKRNRAV